MNRDAKIYVAGHRGLAGSALVRQLRARGFQNLVLRTHAELDLADQVATREFFESERPDCVLLAAARVGGIHANNTYPAEFIYENLIIECNVIHQAYLAGIRDLLFLGSSCIYPKFAPQPMREECLLTASLEPTNEWYAVAKIAGIKLCESYSRQYGVRYRSVMPTNLYGPGDNFHLENSHVVPALMRKFHEAKVEALPEVTVWGSGRPRREFLYVDDFADACLHIMDVEHEAYANVLMCEGGGSVSHINVGFGTDVTIAELAHTVRDVVGYTGRVSFDLDKPDGPPQKLLDVTRLSQLGWQVRVGLEQGLRDTYAWFLENSDGIRK